jgi:hypothetical protein
MTPTFPAPSSSAPVARVSLHPAIAPALPSATSALALVNGEPGALPIVIAHTTLRAGIIGVGLLVSGQRRGIVKNAFVASLAIETFVLGWALYQKSLGAPVAA